MAKAFYHSYRKREWIGDTEQLRNLSIDEAYQVQHLVSDMRIAAGDKAVGYKVGCTSSAIQQQFGLNEPIRGYLYNSITSDKKDPYDCSHYINCAIEPEIVLNIGKDLEGKDLSDEVLLDAIASVDVGVELHEFTFWVKPTTIQELVCSGGIHTGLIIEKCNIDPRQLSFAQEVFHVYINDNLVTKAAATEIMGGPLHCCDGW